MRQIKTEVALAAWLLGALAFSGCMIQVEPTHADQGSIFLLNGEQLEPAGHASPITFRSDNASSMYHVDWMSLVEVDHLVLVLFQALETQEVEFESDKSVTVAILPVAAPTEGESTRDFCIFDYEEIAVPGESYLARGSGRMEPIPEPSVDRKYMWSKWGGGPSLLVTGYGLGGGGTLFGEMKAGEWALVGAGQSGIADVDLRDPANHWSMKITVTGASRVILLPATLFLCGSGFERWGGTTTSPIPVSVGGSMEASGPYGLTTQFQSPALTNGIAVVPGSLGLSQGQMTFGNETVELHDLSNVWRNTYEAAPGALANDQWVSPNPNWMIAGMSIPHPKEDGLDGGG